MPEPIGQHTVKPDPTERTLDTLKGSVASIERELGVRDEIRLREQGSLQDLIETRLTTSTTLSNERLVAVRREARIYETHRLELKADAETHRLELKVDGETHRLELKADGEKTLTTATIAAEKAVQAALAAAEKARDQQTIASQLATTKAEEASKEQMKQQGETFTTAIGALNVGFSDVKSLLGELRAEKRGGQEQGTETRASNSQLIALAVAFMALLQIGVVLFVAFQ